METKIASYYWIFAGFFFPYLSYSLLLDSFSDGKIHTLCFSHLILKWTFFDYSILNTVSFILYCKHGKCNILSLSRCFQFSTYMETSRIYRSKWINYVLRTGGKSLSCSECLYICCLLLQNHDVIYSNWNWDIDSTT